MAVSPTRNRRLRRREPVVANTLELEGRFVIVENAPARGCLETGEQLQELIWAQREPSRVVEVPVFE